MRNHSWLTSLSFLLALSLAPLGSGCAALADDLHRSQEAYDSARYDAALIWLEDLEKDVPDMEPSMRARFYFLRGMTAYRLGWRTEALHYLALARETAGDRGESLGPVWRVLLTRTLTELTPTTGTFRARSRSEAAADMGEEGTPAEDPGAIDEMPPLG